MASPPPHALRLTFAYQGRQVQLIGTERIAMSVPAPSTGPPVAGQTGYWLAVLDAAGRVIYHKPLHSPIRIDVEAFSPDTGQSIARAPVPEREGQFTVLIPDTADAKTFALHGPADPARADEHARELLRLDVDTLRSTKPPPPGAGGTPPPRRTSG